MKGRFIHSVPLIRKWLFSMHICLGTLLLLSAGCAGDPPPPTPFQPAFYHWQTRLSITGAERSLIDSLGVKTLYVKAFDVDWLAGTGPVPVAELELDTSRTWGLRIVPTVFITNRTLKNLGETDLKGLAVRIDKKMRDLFPGPLFHNVSEVQFDCDWTESTRDTYFAFLRHFNSLYSAPPFQVSATIRLHQVRYADRTGVPPVDRGILMCYNTGEVDRWETENSILDPALVRQYLTEEALESYPLPLDMALPVFRWGVLFRDGTLNYLIHDLGPEDVRDTSRFLKMADNRYEVMKSTYLQGYYLYKGDQLRLEGVNPELLKRTAELLKDRLSSSQRPGKSGIVPFSLAFYHLDTTTLQVILYEDLAEVLEIIND